MRRQVCRRARRRAAELGVDGLRGYRRRLECDPGEWRVLDGLTNVTISRFYRDRGVFTVLETDLLPAAVRAARAAGRRHVTVWSAGCASGEEPFTVAIVWELAVLPHLPGVGLEILATDIDPVMLRRAAEARYPRSAVRELPEQWRTAAFDTDGDQLVLRAGLRRRVALARHDLRDDPPPQAPFDVVLCRNVAFTYFDERGQAKALERLARATRSGGTLVIGAHERLPTTVPGFVASIPDLGVFSRARGAVETPRDGHHHRGRSSEHPEGKG